MSDHRQSKSRVSETALTVCLFLAFAGCTAKSRNSKISDNAEAATTAADPSEHYFDGGTYCIQKFTQGPPPPQPLHFSNKVSESDGSAKDFEADLSGDEINQTIYEQHPANDDDRKSIENSGANSSIHDGLAEMKTINHYTRSDQSGWRAAGNGAVMGVAPWGLFILKPPVTRVGTEQVNGYDAVKYIVDTTHESEMEKAAGMLRQVKDYNITGTAWVLMDAACVLQYRIDDEQTAMDGKVSKTHYEGTITKK
jgi:hypothetical protein